MNLFLFLLNSAFWGGSFVAIKIVVGVMPPFFAAFVRVSIALVSLQILYKLFGKSKKIFPEIRYKVWLTGLLAQGIPFSLLFWGEKTISPALGGILNGTTPIWTFILGLLFLRTHEAFSLKKFFGLFIGIAGMLVIFVPKVTIGGTRQELIATAVVMIMAISYAVATVLNRHLFVKQEKMNFYGNLYQQQFASFVYLGIVCLVIEGVPDFKPLLSGPVLIASLYMGICSTAIAFMIFYHLIKKWGAVRAASVNYLIPVFAIIFDFLWNKTLPNIYEFTGIILILVAMFLIQSISFKKKISSGLSP